MIGQGVAEIGHRDTARIGDDAAREHARHAERVVRMVATEALVRADELRGRDLLLREQDVLRIRGEVVIPIRHLLVGAAGIDLAEATVVYSHPSALAQCRRRLEEPAAALLPVLRWRAADPSTRQAHFQG